MIKQTFLSLFFILQFSSSSYADETVNNAKSIIISRILNEIIMLKQKKNTDNLIHASYAQINCIEKLSDTRYGMRDCKKEYKRALLHERIASVKTYKD